MKMTPATLRGTTATVRLRGGPADKETIEMSLLLVGGLWFTHAGKLHHYRHVGGRPYDELTWVGTEATHSPIRSFVGPEHPDPFAPTEVAKKE